PRQGQRAHEAQPQPALLLGPALLFDGHPRGSLHAGHRRLAHRGMDGQSPRTIRRQPSDSSARRLQGTQEQDLRSRRQAMTKKNSPLPSGERVRGEMPGRSVAQKLIDAHLVSGKAVAGEELGLRVDQCLLTDTNGNMAWLQFEAMGFPRVKPARVVSYIDHNVYQTDSRNTDDH